MKTQAIKVRRPFWLGGKQHYAGAVLEVDERTAGELLAMGKAEKCDAPKPKPAARVETPKDEK